MKKIIYIWHSTHDPNNLPNVLFSSDKSAYSNNGGDHEPLKFDDIVDRRYYDKMRPPKPGGELILFKVCIATL